MSRSPSPSSSSVSYYSYSEESEPESFPEKPLLGIGGYDDSVEPVPTEEEATEYLEQLAFEEEKEQIFSGEQDIRNWYVFLVMKYKAFTRRIERIKGMTECVYCVCSSTSKQTASNQRIESCLFIDNKHFCLVFFSNFLEKQN